jgi:hypothetical protein
METVPNKAVVAAAVVILGLAGLGAYQGWRRSAADETQDAGALLPAGAPVTGAKAAAPLTEPPPPAMTETQVREIARQEARAVLRGGSGSSADEAPADGGAAAPAAPIGGTASGAAGTRPAPAPAPAPAPPPVPTPAPAPDTSQAPLF